MNGLNNSDETDKDYSLSLLMIRFWRSKVKVTRSNFVNMIWSSRLCGGKAIHFKEVRLVFI